MTAVTTEDGGAKTTNTITTQDGTQIYCKDWGEGQPVVFSHGWPQSLELVENATLKDYEGAPHGLAVTHKDRLKEDLLTFLSE